MPGIDPAVAVHKLYVDPTFSPIKQKKRLFNDEKNTTIREEAEALLKAKAIRELKFVAWVANVVLLRKSRLNVNPEKRSFRVVSGKFLGYMISARGIEANPDKIDELLGMKPPNSYKEVQKLTRTSIRAQTLTDFIIECTARAPPAIQGLEIHEDITNPLGHYLWMKLAMTTGGCRSTYLGATRGDYGICLAVSFHATNNEAEYEAMILGLRLVKSMGVEELLVKGDS
ncbi:hypothetical protein LIER_39267 [Lithospermum erythrorhizon]|uniref:RNase H type-1 domain-containing protein n=1 Tax=Lithospermum erythrorhizon TaxID=34254 RepID=A0AAV3QG77_LITER